MAEVKQLIGLDVGNKRTGVARASEIARLAEPLKSLPTSEVEEFLGKMSKDQTLGIVVIGLPRNLHNEDTQQTSWVRSWVKDAKTKLDVPFYWQDEALTSKLAETRQITGKKLQDEHALAAAIILQDFLDGPESERVMC